MNNNLNIHSEPSIKSDRGQHSQFLWCFFWQVLQYNSETMKWTELKKTNVEKGLKMARKDHATVSAIVDFFCVNPGWENHRHINLLVIFWKILVARIAIIIVSNIWKPKLQLIAKLVNGKNGENAAVKKGSRKESGRFFIFIYIFFFKSGRSFYLF